MHTNTQFSALMCALSLTTCQILSLPLGGHIMQPRSQIEREAWMKMIRTDNFAEKGQLCFFPFCRRKGEERIWEKPTLTQSSEAEEH